MGDDDSCVRRVNASHFLCIMPCDVMRRPIENLMERQIQTAWSSQRISFAFSTQWKLHDFHLNNSNHSENMQWNEGQLLARRTALQHTWNRSALFHCYFQGFSLVPKNRFCMRCEWRSRRTRKRWRLDDGRSWWFCRNMTSLEEWNLCIISLQLRTGNKALKMNNVLSAFVQTFILW